MQHPNLPSQGRSETSNTQLACAFSIGTRKGPFLVHGATGSHAFSAEAPTAQSPADRFTIDGETTSARHIEEQNTQPARPTVCPACPRSGAAARPALSLVQEKTGHVWVPAKSAGFDRNGTQARTLPIANLKSGRCDNFENTGPPWPQLGTQRIPRVVKSLGRPIGRRFAKTSS